MSTQHSDPDPLGNSQPTTPYPLESGRRTAQPHHDLLWWVTVDEFEQYLDGDLSLRDLGRCAVQRADRKGGAITPDLRDDEWYSEVER